jgi:hypothetical protein
MRYSNHKYFVVLFAIDHLIWISVHEVMPVTIVAKRILARIRTNRFESFVEFFIEPLGGSLTSLSIPAEGFGVFLLGYGYDMRSTHQARLSVGLELSHHARARL